MLDVQEYFDGQVKSIKLLNTDGKATVGVIAPGEYEFGTNTKEYMHVVSGTLEVKQAEETAWKPYKKGSMFEVPCCSSFKVRCSQDVAYLCIYE
jgi:purine/pyrimidine-nucleoside phosphorylase